MAANPPSGPFGYWPISSSSQLSRMMVTMSVIIAHRPPASAARRIRSSPAAMIMSEQTR